MSNLTKEWLNKYETSNEDYIGMSSRKRGRLMMLIGCLYDMADRAKEDTIKEQLLQVSEKFEDVLKIKSD